MLILYAIADRPLPSPLPPVPCGEPLVQLEADGVVGIAGIVERRRAEREGRAPRTPCRRGAGGPADPLLPSRFGSVHASPEALEKRCAPTRDLLAAALREVAGCVEIGVRGVPARDDADAAPATGREYLERRRAEEQLVARVHGPLAERARAARLERDRFRGLVSRPARCGRRLRRRRSRRAQDDPELGLVCSGPWPPYSFAGAARERARPDRRGPRPRASARRGRRSRARLQAACERRPGTGRARPRPARAHARRAPAPADGAAGAAADRRRLARATTRSSGWARRS